jgi:hypothetical protein
LGTAFTYQGQLKSGGSPVTGVYDLRFSLWDALSAGTQIGSAICLDNVSVSNGLFTVSLDFGAQFNGNARFLQIAVKAGGAVGDCAVGIFTTLAPRQPLNGAPYALYASGPWATNGANIFNTNTGDVGIGTASPSRLLHTVGDAVLFERAINDAAVLLRNTLNGTLNAAFGLHNSGASDGYAYLTDQTQTPLLHLRNGNVGIGSATPLTKLHITGGAENTTLADGTLFIQSGSGFGQIMTMDGNEINGWSHLHLNPHASTDVFMVAGGGNVGIDSAAPAARLHIEGGTDSEPTGGGFVVIGSVGSTNISIDNNEIMARNNGAPSTLFLNNDGGDVTIAPGATTRVSVLEITGADVAEKFPVSDEVKPGMVVMIDADHSGKLCLARGAYNRRVAGIASGANGLPVGAVLGNLPASQDGPAIALSGRVWVWCDASTRAIEPGDLLTTSDHAGHAMKVADYSRAQGAVVGKAMTPLPAGETGLVLVLVTLQ